MGSVQLGEKKYPVIEKIFYFPASRSNVIFGLHLLYLQSNKFFYIQNWEWNWAVDEEED